MNASSIDSDAVHHPSHYAAHPSGVEVYRITQQMWCPNLANAFKYMARYEHKGNPVEDILKAAKYVEFEMQRRMSADNYGGILLPQSPPLKWEVRFEPFYLYVAAEPDKHMANKLVALWNADKNDHDAALSWLGNLHQWLLNLGTELEKRATEPVPTIQPLRPLDTKDDRPSIRREIHEFRHDMNACKLPEWDNWQALLQGKWRDILGFEVRVGGKVELEIEDYPRNCIFNPKDNIILRPKEKS